MIILFKRHRRVAVYSGNYPHCFEVDSLASIRSTGPLHLSSAAAIFIKNEFPAVSITFRLEGELQGKEFRFTLIKM